MVRRLSPFGFCLVMLALSAQLLLGARVPAAEAAPPLAWAGVICHVAAAGDAPGGAPGDAPGEASAHLHTRGDDGSGVPQPAHHHAQDCWLCPLCSTLAAPLAILAAPPAVASPCSAAMHCAVDLPPAIAPPVRPPHAAQPRGPPILA